MSEYERRRYRILGWGTLAVALLLLIDSFVMYATHYEQGAPHAFLRGFGVHLQLTRAEDLIGASAVLGALGVVALLLSRRKSVPERIESGKRSESVRKTESD